MHRKFKAKQTDILRHLFLHNKTINIKMNVNNTYLKLGSVSLRQVFQAIQSLNYPHTCLNVRIRRSRKFLLKTLVRVDLMISSAAFFRPTYTYTECSEHVNSFIDAY